jgi:hypothetical protein
MAGFAAMLKTKYKTGPGPVPVQIDQDVALGERYKLMKKLGNYDERVHGDQAVIPIKTSLPANASSAYQSAYQNANKPRYDRFLLPLAKEYVVHFVGWEVMRRAGNLFMAQGNGGAYLNPHVDQAGQKITTCKKHMSWKIWTNTGGAVGQLHADVTLASTTLTFRNPLNVYRIDEGQVLQFSTTDGTSGSLLPGELTVTGIDEDSGSVTVSANLNTIAGMTADCFVFCAGDFGANGAGVLSYVPLTKTAAQTTLYSLDRTDQPQRLGGYRLLRLPGETPVAFVMKMLQKSMTVGAPIDRIWVDPVEMLALCDDLVSREIKYTETSIKSDPKYGIIGFDVIKVMFPGMARSVELIADRYFDPPGGGHLYFGEASNVWEWLSSGPFDWFADDGSQLARVHGSEQYEASYGGYWNQACSAPGWNIIGGREADGISLS